VDITKVRPGQRIAALAGVVLFVVMWFSWYGVDVSKVPGGKAAQSLIAASGVDTTATAWQAFDWIDLLMLLTVIVAVGSAVLVASGRSVQLPVSTASLTAGLGALATLLVLYRLVNEPGPDKFINIKFGAWLGLFSCAAIAYGGWRAMSEDAAPAPIAPDPVAPPPATPA
jgi:hypothetical protein